MCGCVEEDQSEAGTWEPLTSSLNKFLSATTDHQGIYLKPKMTDSGNPEGSQEGESRWQSQRIR